MLCNVTLFMIIIFTLIFETESNTTVIETATDPELDTTTLLFSSNETNVSTNDIKDSIRQIAYYLRAHKFNEYDRRYETNESMAPRYYYKSFPRPPLRALHWEVHQICEKSFEDCIIYLKNKIAQTAAQRNDDTVYIMIEQNWTMQSNENQINDIDSQCRKYKKKDSIRADPFNGPLERYQWRVTASYYMCWFTMKETKILEHLSETCDNFADCLDPRHGPFNEDIRADDNQPYACALYSFCPDPCCPLKHLKGLDECWNSDENPCFDGNDVGRRDCLLQRSQNIDFRDTILNRWNVTCKCQNKGYEWNSMFGMCIDIDECAIGMDDCESKMESCVNLPGSFRCVCQWGHKWNDQLQRCESNPALSTIKLLSKKKEEVVEEPTITVFGRLKRTIKHIFGRNEEGKLNTTNYVIFALIVFGTYLIISLIITLQYRQEIVD